MTDLHILPKLRDSLSYIYVEHAVVQRHHRAVEFVNRDGKTHIPAASLSVLLLGPGTSVTHAAMKLLAESGCSVLWVGEDTTRFYAAGTGETRKGYRLLRQAALVCDATARKQVILAMYNYRFGESLDPSLSIEQIRGHEGARVRNTYALMSRRFRVEWNGREYNRQNWRESDPINRALSAANALLNGICHAAIVSGGYSPGLGFVHTGKQLSFVYDIADLYKTEISIPVAFETVSQGFAAVESRTRANFRDRIREAKLLQRILTDIDQLLAINAEPEQPGDVDHDAAKPGHLWDDANGSVEGGRSWSS